MTCGGDLRERVRRLRRGLVSAVVAATVAARATTALAEDVPTAAAIRAARDDVLRRPEFRYEARRTVPSLLDRLQEWWHSFLHGLMRDHPVLFVVLWIGLGLLLVVLVAHLLWTWRTARRARQVGEDVGELEAAIRRLDPAPFRERSLAHAAAGRFDEAVRDLYTALLLTMDRRGAVRYARHKAMLDYRIESARDAEARSVLDRFADSYPPGSFGLRPPDETRFRALVAALDSLSVRQESAA